MTHVVTEACIRCKYTDCVDVCPVDCFREGPNFLTIDPDECIDCAVCIPECPVNAIYAEEDVPEDAIIVTGYRQALESAAGLKRDAPVIAEAFSAEDIGKLPDASIGESIARLPGVTSQRLNGRSNNISIRGFGPDFSQTLLNGREQTSTGDNRAVEFDQYPSEIVSQVVVFKSPTASLVGQGLGGRDRNLAACGKAVVVGSGVAQGLLGRADLLPRCPPFRDGSALLRCMSRCPLRAGRQMAQA